MTSQPPVGPARRDDLVYLRPRRGLVYLGAGMTLADAERWAREPSADREPRARAAGAALVAALDKLRTALVESRAEVQALTAENGELRELIAQHERTRSMGGPPPPVGPRRHSRDPGPPPSATDPTAPPLSIRGER